MEVQQRSVTRSALQAALFTPQCYICIVHSCSHVHESTRGADTGNCSSIQNKRSKEIFTFEGRVGFKPSCRAKLNVLDHFFSRQAMYTFMHAVVLTPCFCSIRCLANPQISENLKLRLPWLL